MIRMLGYYLAHSFLNQVRKMLRARVLILLLVCCLLGGVIGAVGGSLVENSGDQAVSESQEQADGSGQEDGTEETMPSDTPMANLFPGVDRGQIPEAAIALISIVLFFYAAFASDRNGSAIFLPADAALLFPSPLQPQSVLLFRLTARMGAMVFLVIVLAFNLPALMDLTGISPGGGIAFLAALLFLLFYQQLLQTVFYTYAGSAPDRKKKLRTGTYISLLTLAAACALWISRSSFAPQTAAVHFLIAPAGRFIPIWGWMRGLIFYAAEGKWILTAVFAALLAAGCALLLFLIRHMKADFYEDAQAKSEQTAAALEEIQNKGTIFSRKAEKDRSDSLKRDGLKKGRGADAFFWKTIYNHFRFAHFYVFTKTAGTYLAVSIAASLLAGRIFPDQQYFVPVLVLAACVFFRTLRNPLETDLSSPVFFLTPEPFWKKLFWSELGGLAECLLDLLPGLIAGSVLTGSSPAFTGGACFFILTLYFYSMNISAFLGAVFPADTGLSVRQLVQVMFVYFGLIPDAALLAAGFSSKVPQISPLMGSGLACAVNAAAGFLFLCLIPVFLDPRPKKPAYRVSEPTEQERKAAGKEISYAGFICLLLYASGAALQMMLSAAAGSSAMGIMDTKGWLTVFLPLYAAAFPLGLFLMGRKRNPESMQPPAWEMTPARLAACLAAAVFLMSAGSMIGNLLNMGLGQLTGRTSADSAQLLAAAGDSFWKIFFVVIAGPVFEELFFRKALIDRLVPLGERFAILFSAAAFGLFHGNLVQLCYAFLLGLLFAWIYVRTRQIRWTIGLHMLINFIGSVLSPKLLMTGGDLSAAAVLFTLILAGLMAAGLIVIIKYAGEIYFTRRERELPRRTAAALTWKSPGFLAFLALMVFMMIYSVLV